MFLMYIFFAPAVGGSLAKRLQRDPCLTKFLPALFSFVCDVMDWGDKNIIFAHSDDTLPTPGPQLIPNPGIDNLKNRPPQQQKIGPPTTISRSIFFKFLAVSDFLGTIVNEYNKQIIELKKKMD